MRTYERRCPVARDPDGKIVLEDTKVTTRRMMEVAAVDLLRRHADAALKELDEAIALIEDRMVEDGECEIRITVTQKMKPRSRTTTCGCHGGPHGGYTDPECR